MTDTCNQCGNRYKVVAQHWSKSNNCSHPDFTDKQLEVTVGLLMGDGCLFRSGDGHPRLQSKMISKEYLNYVDEVFGKFGKGVTLCQTAEKSAEENRESGFSESANARNYSDKWRWFSMSHPDFQKFSDWYSSGEKVWPDNIKLTPTVLKHWYCGDGNFHKSGTPGCIRISMLNESRNTEKVDQMFRDSGLPVPSNYDTSKYKCDAVFTVEDSKKLWDYMGKPLPDLQYKWPQEYR